MLATDRDSWLICCAHTISERRSWGSRKSPELRQRAEVGHRPEGVCSYYRGAGMTKAEYIRTSVL